MPERISVFDPEEGSEEVPPKKETLSERLAAMAQEEVQDVPEVFESKGEPNTFADEIADKKSENFRVATDTQGGSRKEALGDEIKYSEQGGKNNGDDVEKAA